MTSHPFSRSPSVTSKTPSFPSPAPIANPHPPPPPPTHYWMQLLRPTWTPWTVPPAGRGLRMGPAVGRAFSTLRPRLSSKPPSFPVELGAYSPPQAAQTSSSTLCSFERHAYDSLLGRGGMANHDGHVYDCWRADTVVRSPGHWSCILFDVTAWIDPDQQDVAMSSYVLRGELITCVALLHRQMEQGPRTSCIKVCAGPWPNLVQDADCVLRQGN